MKVSVLITALCLALCLTACGNQEASTTSMPDTQQSQSSEAGTSGVLSQFTGQNLQGESVDQKILQGHKLTMVNVWATFCTPCINEMPDLGALSQEYSDKGFQIVGLVSDVMASDGSIDQGQVSLAQEIVNSTSANYTHIIPGEDLYGLLYQITSVPTTFFVDENGNQVGNAYVGAKDKETWKGIIEQLLKEVGE